MSQSSKVITTTPGSGRSVHLINELIGKGMAPTQQRLASSSKVITITPGSGRSVHLINELIEKGMIPKTIRPSDVCIVDVGMPSRSSTEMYQQRLAAFSGIQHDPFNGLNPFEIKIGMACPATD